MPQDRSWVQVVYLEEDSRKEGIGEWDREEKKKLIKGAFLNWLSWWATGAQILWDIERIRLLFNIVIFCLEDYKVICWESKTNYSVKYIWAVEKDIRDSI